MLNPNIACVIAFLVCAFIHGVHNLDYSDLEALGVACPNLQDRYKCVGYRSSVAYNERGCECDSACNTYNDCCINALRRRNNRRTSSIRNRMTCLPTGENTDGGVYVIATCRNNWTGASQVRQKCEGQIDLSDPLNAAPVTSVSQAITYRNRYCAECNDADMTNLKTFQLKLSCPELSPFLTEEQIYADLKYDQQLEVWGVDRLNSFGNATNFLGCEIMFDVPSYFNNKVRFCQSNIISNCPPDYTRHPIRKACRDYMAVVYDDHQGFRNPHCAICNGRKVDEVHCKTELDSRKRPMSFALLLDINQSDGDQVGMRRVATPECASNHKYDPFFKKCRQLVCALPGYVVVDGRCVRQA